MDSCIMFPVRQTTDVIFYITNVVITPLLFGIGVTGSLLGLIVFNYRYIRRESAVYVYLSGLALMDLLTMLSIVPASIRDMEVLPPEITYGKLMTYIVTFSKPCTSIFRYAGTWMLALAVVVRCVGVKEPLGKDSRMSRISVSRVVAFLLLLLSILVNFSAFFQTRVTEVVGHCFTGLSLWSWELTEFGRSEIAREVIPWAVYGVLHALPLLVLAICLLVLCAYTGCGTLCRKSLILRRAHDEDEREWQLTAALVTTAGVFTLLELPSLVCHTLSLVYGDVLLTNNMYYWSESIANCLSLVHVALNVIIFALNNADFRKALGRSCCCLCNTTDEYYEPVTCTTCCGRTRRKYEFPKESKKEKRRSSKSHKSTGSSDKSSSKVSDDDSQTSFGVKYHQVIGQLNTKNGWI